METESIKTLKDYCINCCSAEVFVIRIIGNYEIGICKKCHKKDMTDKDILKIIPLPKVI